MPLTEDEQIEARLNRIGTYQAGTLMTETGEVWYPADLLLPAANEIERLRAAVTRLQSENLCAVCAGIPPVSGLSCICGGTGRACDEALHARERVFDLERQLAEAQHWLKSRETELKTAQDALAKAYEDLALAREENLTLRQKETKT